MHTFNMLEDEASRIDLRQVNGVQHARRVVARFQYVVNGKPAVSDCLLLGVPELYVNSAVVVSSRERASRLDCAVGEGFQSECICIQAIAA